MNATQTILKALASYRAWRDAQRAYAQALEGEDAAQIAATEEHLHATYQEYIKYYPQEGANHDRPSPISPRHPLRRRTP